MNRMNGSRRRPALASLLLAAALIGASPTAALAASYYEDALQRYEAKDYPGAIIQLKNALKKEPNKLAIQFLLGKALQQNGDALQAEVAYNEAISLGISRSEVAVPLAQTLMAQGRHRDMLFHPQLQPAGLPVEVQQKLILLRGSAQSDLGDHRSALETIASARALNDRKPEAWLTETPVRIRTRQFTEALQTAERGIAVAPNEAEGYYVRGSVWHAQGQIDTALNDYKKALAIDPMHTEALVASAGIQLDRKLKDDAQRTLDQLRKAAPQEPRAAYMRSILAEMTNRPDQIKSALQEVTLLLDPVPVGFVQYRPQLLMLNGLAHYSLGELPKARQYLEALNKVQPNSPAVRLLARIQLADGNSATAIPLLEGYLRTYPDDGMALTLLGSAYIAQGKTAKATQILQEALKKQDKAELRAALGVSLLRSGNPSAAMTELESAWRKDPSQIAAGLTLAQLYMDQNKLPQALSLTRDLIKRQPAHAGLQHMLGDVLSRSGQQAAARQAYEQALKIKPESTQSAIQLIRLDINDSQLESAQRRVTALLREQPKNSDALAEQSRISDRQGKPEEALRWLIRAREVSDKKDLRWNHALIELYMRQGKVPQASEEVKLALEKQPDNLNTLMVQARIELAGGNAAAARNTLANATRVAQFDAPAQTAIAQMQLTANNVSGAAYSLSKALSEHPRYLPAQVLLAQVELKQGEADKAEQRARQIVLDNPKQAIGPGLQADLAMARGDLNAAVSLYRQARNLESNTATNSALMRALSAQGAIAEALEVGRQRLRQAPGDVLVQLMMADLYARSNKFTDAAAGYRAVLKQQPLNVEALNNLANVQIKLSDLTSARRTAEQAQKAAPNNPLAVDTLGWVMYLQGQFEQALPLLRDARLRAPDNPEIRYHLAKVLVASKRLSEARTEAREALRLSSNFDGAQDAKALAAGTP